MKLKDAEKKIADLERRIADLEARPIQLQPYYVPQPYPVYPQPYWHPQPYWYPYYRPWDTTATSVSVPTVWTAPFTNNANVTLTTTTCDGSTTYTSTNLT